jgi:hypothetical protein
MAFVHGKNAYFNIDSVGGSPTDISSYTTSVDFPRSVETADVTTFGNSAKKYITGLSDATISIEGKWDPTVDALLDGLVGANEGDFIYGPAGSSSGNVKYTGKCILTEYNPPADVTTEDTFTASFQVSGAISRQTF